jgi:hypothetical protein
VSCDFFYSTSGTTLPVEGCVLYLRYYIARSRKWLCIRESMVIKSVKAGLAQIAGGNVYGRSPVHNISFAGLDLLNILFS